MNAQALQGFPADRVYIQLALTGPPVFVPPSPSSGMLVKPAVEDATAPPLAALAVVTQADLDKTRDVLVRAGIHGRDIELRLPSAADPNRRMGQVLVAVAPLTTGNFDRVAQIISAVTSRYPQIAQAGIVLQRNRCDAQRIVESAALHDARTRAALLAHAAGLASGNLLENAAWFSDSTSPYQMGCGGQVPHITASAAPVYPGTLANRPYSVSDNRAILFRLAGAWKGRTPRVRFDRVNGHANDAFLPVSHRFAVPDGEPFVSAQGRFEGIVHADAIIAIFYTASPFRHAPPQLWRDIADAIRAPHFPDLRVTRDGRRGYVRLPEHSALPALEKKIAAVREKYAAYSIGVGAVPVVSDCRAVRAAAAAAAFSAARRRALAMTSAAHVRMGRVFAISDAGESVGALCHRADAPVEELMSALDAQAGPSPEATGSGAAFSSAAVAAWELQVPPVPRSASWPQPGRPDVYSAIYQAFITHGTGVLGEDKTVEAATRDALEMLHGAPLQALIDQGEATDGSPAFKQRVLAVGGT